MTIGDSINQQGISVATDCANFVDRYSRMALRFVDSPKVKDIDPQSKKTLSESIMKQRETFKNLLVVKKAFSSGPRKAHGEFQDRRSSNIAYKEVFENFALLSADLLIRQIINQQDATIDESMDDETKLENVMRLQTFLKHDWLMMRKEVAERALKMVEEDEMNDIIEIVRIERSICPICQCRMKASEDLNHGLSCSHRFHRDCGKLLYTGQKQKKCPIAGCTSLYVDVT
ncbi:hypothetical protein ACOME3_010189 [Neoechinorhynchus agilis]